MIEESKFLSSPNGIILDGDGSVTFSEVTVNRLSFQDSISQSTIRFQDAVVQNFDIQDSEIGSLACHEEVIAKKDATRKTELNETMIFNVSMSNGMYCDQTTFNGLHLEGIRVRDRIDLCQGDIENLVAIEVTSLSNQTSSEFALCSTEVRGKLIADITTSKITFARTIFSEPMKLEGFSVMNTSTDLTDTVFSQERINNECCTVSCLSQGCKCDIPLEPLFCPRGNSSVNVNVKDSCFPADSTVSVVNSHGRIDKKRMQDLQHGDLVMHANDAPPTDIFFFGHRTEQYAHYRIFETIVTDAQLGEDIRTLAISKGHLLPVIGRGVIPAREIKIGDALVTVEGGQAIVAKAKDQILRGMYAPTSLSGELAVNGIRVSCYTDIVPSWLAHVTLAPLRGMYRLGGSAVALVMSFDLLHEKSFAWLVEPFVRELGKPIRSRL